MQPSREPGPGAELAPLWNLASVLVPLAAMVGWLLLRAAAPASAVAEAPAQIAADGPIEVHIHGDGYLVDGVAGLPGVRADGTLHIPCRDGKCASADAYDTDRLTEVLTDVHGAAPDRQRLELIPSWETPYAVLIRTLEAARGEDQLFAWVEIRRPR